MSRGVSREELAQKREPTDGGGDLAHILRM